jgi:hypothetical protein
VAETDQADFGKVSKRVRTAGGGASGTVRCVHPTQRGMRTRCYGHAHVRKQGVTSRVSDDRMNEAGGVDADWLCCFFLFGRPSAGR